MEIQTSDVLNSMKWGIGFAIILLAIGLFYNVVINNELYSFGDLLISSAPFCFLLGLVVGLYFSLEKKKKVKNERN